MAKQPFFGNWRNIATVSYGVVYIFFNLWVIFHIPQFVPSGQETIWYRVLSSYLILNIVVLGSADLRNKLFDVKLVDFLPRFFMYTGFFLIGWFLIVRLFDPLSGSAISVISNIPLWLALLHALTFATTESVIWQGYLDQKIGQPWSAISAGVFHLFIWTGSAIIVIIGAGALFLLFSYVNWRFRTSKKDLVPAISCHTAYNIVKLGTSIGGM